MHIARSLSVLLLLAVAACSQGPAADAADSNGENATGETEDELRADPLGPEPAGSHTRYPIVLAHGFDGSPTNRWGFYGIKEALEADGQIVHVAAVPPYDSPEVRAKALAQHVDAALKESGAKKVNIIAHSMGGLDSRVLISSLGYGDRVASLTTISTPHRGTAVADVALKIMPGNADEAVNALAKAWAKSFTSDDLANDTHVRAAMSAISEKNAPAFNAAHPNDARVFYQSWAGVSSFLGLPNGKDDGACDGKLLRHAFRNDVMDGTLVGGAAIVAHGTELRPNDGMATVESAKWGTFRGCVPADHLDEVGQPKHDGPVKHTGFDATRFYRNVAFDLARSGF
jgi:triacylglycerol lipase